MIDLMTPIKCSIGSINLPNGDAADGRYYVRHNGIVHDQTIYEDVGQQCGLSAALARAVGETLFNAIAKHLQLGHRVELPQLAAFLSVQGKKASTAKGHVSVEPKPTVHLVPRGNLKDCCKGAFSVDVVTPQASVVIDSFVDTRSKRFWALTNGTDVEVHLAGLGLFMPDPSDQTVGVWAEDASGKLRFDAKVTKSTSTTLDAVFPKIDLPVGEGSYLCVASRDGMPGTHSVRTVRRRALILPAIS